MRTQSTIHPRTGQGRTLVPAIFAAALVLGGCAATHVGDAWQCPLAQGAACTSVAEADPAVAAPGKAQGLATRTPLYQAKTDDAKGSGAPATKPSADTPCAGGCDPLAWLAKWFRALRDRDAAATEESTDAGHPTPAAPAEPKPAPPGEGTQDAINDGLRTKERIAADLDRVLRGRRRGLDREAHWVRTLEPSARGAWRSFPTARPTGCARSWSRRAGGCRDRAPQGPAQGTGRASALDPSGPAGAPRRPPALAGLGRRERALYQRRELRLPAGAAALRGDRRGDAGRAGRHARRRRARARGGADRPLDEPPLRGRDPELGRTPAPDGRRAGGDGETARGPVRPCRMAPASRGRTAIYPERLPGVPRGLYGGPGRTGGRDRPRGVPTGLGRHPRLGRGGGAAGRAGRSAVPRRGTRGPRPGGRA